VVLGAAICHEEMLPRPPGVWASNNSVKDFPGVGEQDTVCGLAEPGIYLCGLDQGLAPAATISHALAAAEQALSYRLARDHLSGAVAVVDKRRCMAASPVRGCGFKVPVMVSLEALNWHKGTGRQCLIDPARCQGCGICAADCRQRRSGSITATTTRLSATVCWASGWWRRQGLTAWAGTPSVGRNITACMRGG
jgi:Pyruvate/2-oxoacid:ferredoxin oxidoreductase delta subunit